MQLGPETAGRRRADEPTRRGHSRLGQFRPAGRDGQDPVPVSPPTTDKREIFKQMVVGELEAGFLRYSRRQALLQYAAKVGIPEFEATLLIAEAQFYSDRIDPIRLDHTLTMDTETGPELWPAGSRLLLALAIAALVDLLVISWLF